KVLVLWAIVLALMVMSALALGGQKDNSFSVPGTESQRAEDLLREKFPGAGGASARIVFSAPRGERLTDPANRAAIEKTLAETKSAPNVTQVVDPFTAGTLTADKRLGFADVIYPVPPGEIDNAARNELAASVKPARAGGLRVEFGGGLVTEAKESSA